MNEQQTSPMDQSATYIEIPPLTSSKPKKIILSMVFGLCLVYLIVSIFWDKPNKKMPQIEEESTSIQVYQPPKIKKIPKEELKTESSKESIDLEKNENQLMLLRQHAPIQVYLASENKVPEKQNEDSLSQIQNNIGQPSPMSMQTINNGPDSFANTEAKLSDKNSNAISEKNMQVTRLKHPDYLLIEGTVIPGILQTAIHSDLSGNLKAMVAEDVYATQGSRVLIPKGSTLLGRYSGNTTQQQSRILVVWTRMIRPDGISIKLQADGTDEIGQAGLSGNVNHHYLARFGQASLLSLIGAGVASSQFLPAETYPLAIANSFASTGKETLQESMQIKPTITIKAGTQVAVYVNQDISFYPMLR